jgi:hypothetical protein
MARTLEFYYGYGSPYSYLADNPGRGHRQARRGEPGAQADAAGWCVQGDR